MDDYYFDGNWPNIVIGDSYTSIVGVVGYSYDEFKIYPRSENDFDGCVAMGDINGDGLFNILDLVQLANCVLSNNCVDHENACAADLNGDSNFNILDIVTLVNCVLSGSCDGCTGDLNSDGGYNVLDIVTLVNCVLAGSCGSS